MAVVLKDALFLHIPKTGGEWVRQVLWDAGLETVKLHPGKQKHADLAWFKEHPEYDRPFRFAFVRHPVAWYRSFWAYQDRRGWRWIPEVDLCPLHTPIAYPEFLKWVVEEHPGFLGRLYQRYTGPFDRVPGTPLSNEIQFIGRTENLRFDLRRALSNCNRAYGRNPGQVPWRLIHTIPMLNASGVLPGVSRELEDQVVAAEEEVCQRFGYL